MRRLIYFPVLIVVTLFAGCGGDSSPEPTGAAIDEGVNKWTKRAESYAEQVVKEDRGQTWAGLFKTYVEIGDMPGAVRAAQRTSGTRDALAAVPMLVGIGHPEEAFELVETIRDPEIRQGAIAFAVFRHADRHEFDEALEAVKKIEASGVRNRVLKQIVVTMGRAGQYDRAETLAADFAPTGDDALERRAELSEKLRSARENGRSDPPVKNELAEPVPAVDVVRVAADTYKKYRSLRGVLNGSEEDAESHYANVLHAEESCEKAWELLESGDEQKCIDAIEESLGHANKIEDPFEKGFRLIILADLWLELDRPVEAKVLVSQAIATKFYQKTDREEKTDAGDLSGLFDGMFDFLGGAVSAPIITSVLVRTDNVDVAFEYARQTKTDSVVTGLPVWGVLAAFCVTEGHYSEMEKRVASLPSPKVQVWFCQGVVSGLLELKRREETK